MITHLIKKTVFLAILTMMLVLGNNGLKAEPQLTFNDSNNYFVEYLYASFSHSFAVHTDYNTPVPITYSIIGNNDVDYPFFNIDTNGTVISRPLEPGYYGFLVKANVTDDTTNYIEMAVTIYVNDTTNYTPCAKITGQLLISGTNKPVKNATVAAYQDVNEEYYIVNDEATTDENGFFSIPINEGKYYLYAYGANLLATYYENSVEMSDATSFNIVCGDSISVTFHAQRSASIIFDPSYKGIVRTIGDSVDYTPQYYTYDSISSLKFTLIYAPQDMTIDPNTGEIKWVTTNTYEGAHDFYIYAYDQNDTTLSGYQYVSILILPGDIQPCATIKGVLVDYNGNPVPNAYLVAYDYLYNYYDLYDFNGLSNYYSTTMTADDGSFEFNFPAGDYYLYVESDQLYPMVQYYNVLDSSKNDNTIPLVCGDNLNLTFKVNKAIITYDTVSGRVYSKEDNTPIQAYIDFYCSVVRDTTYGDNYGYNDYYYAETDSNGYYSVVLRSYAGGSFRAVAEPYGQEYDIQFYDQTSDFTQAKDMYFGQNYTNIDFPLTKVSDYDNGFTGKVQNESGEGLNAVIIAWYDDFYCNNLFYSTQTDMTDSTTTGQFSFSKIQYGTYYLLAIPLGSNYLPGFYVDGADATLDFGSASYINVPYGQVLPNPVIITLAELKKGHGIMLVNGNVLNTSYEKLSGAIVAVKDNQDNTIGYAQSTSNGQYVIKGLSEGNYKLIASKPGYESTQISFTVGTNDTVKSENIMLHEKATSAVKENTNNNLNLTVYPNPASDNAMITIPQGKGKAQLNIYNTIGNVIISEEVDLSENNYTTINTSSLPVGLYNIQITNNNKNYNTTLVIAR